MEEKKEVNSDDKLREFIFKAKEDKKFLLFSSDGVCVVNKCPECGYVFSEEDYDSCEDYNSCY